MFGPGDPEVLAQLQPGDEVEVDNRGYLAAQTYHRHQVPGRDFSAWDQFRDPDGSPIYPNAHCCSGPLFAAAAAGNGADRALRGKDDRRRVAPRPRGPPLAGRLVSHRRVEEHLGNATDDHFRLWFTDNALHGDDVEIQESPTHTVSYLGVLHQALRDLSVWVEKGVAPSTEHEL